MVLTPDLIKQEELTVMTPAAKKARYNFDELVRRIVKLDP
jgi:BMFP domain-containing protein YqiC